MLDLYSIMIHQIGLLVKITDYISLPQTDKTINQVATSQATGGGF